MITACTASTADTTANTIIFGYRVTRYNGIGNIEDAIDVVMNTTPRILRLIIPNGGIVNVSDTVVVNCTAKVGGVITIDLGITLDIKSSIAVANSAA